jgi:hypothetical protein
MPALIFVIKLSTTMKNVLRVVVQKVQSEQSGYENTNVDVRSCC